MKPETACNVVNLMCVGLLWVALVAVPNVVHGAMFPIGVEILLVLVALPISGYIVQHTISGFVNALFMPPRSD